MILDVGCGNIKRGDINIDLGFVTDEVLQEGKPIRIYPDMLASGDYLPFIDNCFETVIAFHVIEHSNTPLKFLKELLRVSSRDVFIRVPHKDGRIATMPYHVSLFNEQWFESAVPIFGIEHLHIECRNDQISYDKNETELETVYYPFEVCVFITKQPMELVYHG
jgi:SAM-dependent methyltransferase